MEDRKGKLQITTRSFRMEPDEGPYSFYTTRTHRSYVANYKILLLILILLIFLHALDSMVMVLE